MTLILTSEEEQLRDSVRRFAAERLSLIHI